MTIVRSDIKVYSRFFCNTKIPNTKVKNIKFVYNYFVPDEATNSTGITKYDKGFYSGGSISGGSFFVDSDGNKFMQAPDGSVSSASDVLMRSPRQVELDWTPPVTESELINQDSFTNVFTIQEVIDKNLMIYDEDIRSSIDTHFQRFDPRVDRRLQTKTNLLLKLCGYDAYTITAKDQLYYASTTAGNSLNEATKHEDDTNLKTNIDKLFVLNETEGSKRVNELSPEDSTPAFLRARSALIETYVDRRMIRDLADSSFSRYHFSRAKMTSYFENDSGQRENLPAETAPPVDNLSQGADRQKEINIETPFLPAWVIETNSEISTTNTTYGNFSMVKLVGYIVDRYDGTISDLSTPSRRFLLDRPNPFATCNVIDSEVLYGSEYFYSIRSVYCREFFDIDSTDDKPKRMQQWIASKPTEPIYVKAVEYVPPKEPDGVFYKFNYGKRKGLIITWQYPSDRKRDTKYFQIFRRKSVHHPFECIAEIDFNDADISHPRREHVDLERVIKKKGITTHFQDIEFDRDSKFIYAVASVDAHGLTSGYSHQTMASFDRKRNELILKGISRSGAPKQYPNFFVDPQEDETTFVRTFTEDCFRVSGKKKMTVIYAPDCLSYQKYNPDNVTLDSDGTVVYFGGPPEVSYMVTSNVITDNEKPSPGRTGHYKIHLINTDRQKDDALEIRITDFRGKDIYQQE